MTFQQHETVLIAPDGCTKYLQSAVDSHLRQAQPPDTVRIEFSDECAKAEMATWCLEGGLRIHNPFAHFTDTSLVVGHRAGRHEQAQVTGHSLFSGRSAESGPKTTMINSRKRGFR